MLSVIAAAHTCLEPAEGGRPVKVVSERLGHASPAFAMTVYQQVLPGMQPDAAAKFSADVFGDDEASEGEG